MNALETLLVNNRWARALYMRLWWRWFVMRDQQLPRLEYSPQIVSRISR